ncbi:MAG: flagellar biosynthesis protein FlgE [Proteobacteria bacterium]|nr:MAG: flagellar biosynthesis protein FlgE [Pseudomonadota bacterium]
MPFNVALSGLNAAQSDLEVTGNNIANASTVGFKQSRTEFMDLYANSFLSASTNPVGNGVKVANVRQMFEQGNISFTERGLDMAINGNGFFMVQDGGVTKYTRSGQFGIDLDGYVVNSQGMRLQGFDANEEGVVSGVRADVQVSSKNLDPSRTTLVDPQLNLDASEKVLEKRGQSYVSNGSLVGKITAGVANGFPAVDFVFTKQDNTKETLTTTANQSAGAIAAKITTAVKHVEASAITRAAIQTANYSPEAADSFTVNGVTFSGSDLATVSSLAVAINSSALGGVSAVVEDAGLATERLLITHSQGADLFFSYFDDGNGTGAITVDGLNGTSSVVGSHAFPADGVNAVVGGILTIIAEEGVSLNVYDSPQASPPAANTDIYATVTGAPFRDNIFDPNDPETYNHSTSTTIYDSLGSAHVLTMFFVKQAASSTTVANTWQMHALIDGADVGDPVTAGGDPTRASYTLIFDEDGILRKDLSDKVLISNWQPKDAAGNYNGAAPPNNVVDGGRLPIPDPPQSSNFEIDLTGTTQFGSPFTVTNMQQNGYTTGRLVNLEVDDSGDMFAQYSNGQSVVLAQISLATFNDIEGLAPVGDTAWTQTAASGDPIVGAPGTGVLGTVQGSAVEDSNVDLSDQLVNLIIAQRNYQANAKTIETADTVTQTIINLR